MNLTEYTKLTIDSFIDTADGENAEITDDSSFVTFTQSFFDSSDFDSDDDCEFNHSKVNVTNEPFAVGVDVAVMVRNNPFQPGW